MIVETSSRNFSVIVLQPDDDRDAGEMCHTDGEQKRTVENKRNDSKSGERERETIIRENEKQLRKYNTLVAIRHESLDVKLLRQHRF